MQPLLYVFLLVLSHVVMIRVLSIKKEFFIKNIELEQLLADGIISREDIYKLPVCLTYYLAYKNKFYQRPSKTI